MTKAELIEEVSRVVEMTRKDSEMIVEAIFDSIVRAIRGGITSRSGALEASARASGSRAWDVIRKRARA